MSQTHWFASRSRTVSLVLIVGLLTVVIGAGFTAAVSAQSSSDSVEVNETITNESSQEILEESIVNETSETGTDVPEIPESMSSAIAEFGDGLFDEVNSGDEGGDGVADDWFPF